MWIEFIGLDNLMNLEFRNPIHAYARDTGAHQHNQRTYTYSQKIRSKYMVTVVCSQLHCNQIPYSTFQNIKYTLRVILYSCTHKAVFFFYLSVVQFIDTLTPINLHLSSEIRNFCYTFGDLNETFIEKWLKILVQIVRNRQI